MITKASTDLVPFCRNSEDIKGDLNSTKYPFPTLYNAHHPINPELLETVANKIGSVTMDGTMGCS